MLCNRSLGFFGGRAQRRLFTVMLGLYLGERFTTLAATARDIRATSNRKDSLRSDWAKSPTHTRVRARPLLLVRLRGSTLPEAPKRFCPTTPASRLHRSPRSTLLPPTLLASSRSRPSPPCCHLALHAEPARQFLVDGLRHLLLAPTLLCLGVSR